MRRRQTKPKKESPMLKVIPIGGLNEIGKNLTLLEYQDEILIIDCGLSFPEDEMYGIDIVIPDFSYLIANRSKIVGMVITHGHEDHIGAIPYLLKHIKIPVYGTRLTLGLVENKLKEHEVIGDLRTINAGDKFKLGEYFDIETIRTTHSIADAICLAITTPAGVVFHSGDFKIDYTPIDGEPIDFSKLAQIGKKGVTLMLCDSTNAVRPGYTASERVVGQTIENIFRNSKNRIIIATFSSNVHRVQKIIENAVKVGRKVAVSGRSMENVVALAIELGYLNIPAGTLVDLKMTKNIPDDKLVIITTGSQGEPMSALSRIASGEHKAVKLKKGDTVILSSTPIPGNEKTVSNVVNKLFEKGAEVIYSDIADIHVSGHACQEELKIVHGLTKPRYFIPVHGEQKHLQKHAALARQMGMNPKNILIADTGSVIECTPKTCKLAGTVPAGKILVDGTGVGDVGSVVLRDRKHLAQDGMIVVCVNLSSEDGSVLSGPDIISRGFVYMKDNEDLMDAMKMIATHSLEVCHNRNISDWATIKSTIKGDLSQFLFKNTKRNPMILPVIMEI